MAVRIRSRFHAAGQSRSMATLASVVAVLSWKLAIDALNRMREADYDIDIGRPYLDFVSEFTVFLALLADRIAYRDLDADQRVEFTTALAKRLSSLVEENFGTYLVDVIPDETSRQSLNCLIAAAWTMPSSITRKMAQTSASSAVLPPAFVKACRKRTSSGWSIR